MRSRAYVARVAASWAALLKSLQERQESGKALTAGVVWNEFKRVAERSSREDVKRLADVGEGMTPEDRGRFAVAVMPLLMKLDWPPAWEAARPGLITAVEALRDETDAGNLAGSTEDVAPFSEARGRYREAFECYARAARAMNDAAGAVRFQNLDFGADEGS